LIINDLNEDVSHLETSFLIFTQITQTSHETLILSLDDLKSPGVL